MERLFRDRMEYVGGARRDGCFICESLADDNDAENLLLQRADKTAIFLNRFPYNSGHLLVTPVRHAPDIEDFDDEELLEIMQSVKRCVRLLRQMKPEGFNVGVNLGEAGGAGLPGHFHVHVVPRWVGDTNFMPVTADAKVMPESLEATYAKLKSGL